MSDYSSFRYGGAVFPLTPSTAASLLFDADSSLFYALEFYAAMLNTHLSTRLLAEAAAVGADHITVAVAETLPLNPEPFLTEDQIRFPMLCAWRKNSKPGYIGGKKIAVSDIEVAYVLPPLTPGEAERLMPILKAAASIIDNRTEEGADPSYQPTGGAFGDSVWLRANVAVAEAKNVAYGGYQPTDKLFFPAVVVSLELKEVSDVQLTDFVGFNGVDVAIDLKEPVQQTVVPDFIDFSTASAPTLVSLSPNTGTKQGNTSVTITGTGFVLGTTPKVWFGGVAATSVVVVSTTSITCKTPAHDAFPTEVADVFIQNVDGQQAELVDSFTFTSP